MEKRALFVRPNSGISGEHYIQRSDDHHYLRKRTFKSLGTLISLLLNPNGGIGGEGNDNFNFRKRRDPSHNKFTKTVKRDSGYDSFNPQSGYGDDLKKRRNLSSSANNISKIVKRGGGYNPSSPQGGESGGHGEGGYGNDLKKRSSTKSDTFRKREGELDPVDPFANVAKGGADLK
ncbi:hypothetical protein EC957_008450 [Mortierella hygrophila]|uniref:Uncharacterized protein n=1 Tax=Mortierella hygrophila TaxID=979708 RepID=A0A9P6K5N2_9FUNG|nr:hypothetical protein EC957_008450 [Mortierella hygrophila]